MSDHTAQTVSAAQSASASASDADIKHCVEIGKGSLAIGTAVTTATFFIAHPPKDSVVELIFMMAIALILAYGIRTVVVDAIRLAKSN